LIGIPQRRADRSVRLGAGTRRRRRYKEIVTLDASWEVSRSAVRLGGRREVKWEAGGAGRSGAGAEIGGGE